jgi:hypothetical protein
MTARSRPSWPRWKARPEISLTAASEIASAKDDKEGFEKRSRGFEADSGFMRFLSLSHGSFLSPIGFPAKVQQYTIDNPLIAAAMLQHDIGAALNVPVRLVIYEGEDGRTTSGTTDHLRS